MIIRLLLLFLIVWFLFWLLKKQFSEDAPVKSENKKESLEDMLVCSYCGTHVPESLGIKSADKFYCCQQHVDLDQQKKDDK